MKLIAKKSFGQHFLHQQNVLQKIAQLVVQHPLKNILEIGPGKGALTKYLLHDQIQFKAVEADRDMQDYLINQKILNENQLIRDDVLKMDFANLFDGEDFILCGNFPYNISSQILIKTLLNTDSIPLMVGMFQKEVVTRIISAHGNKDYGTLSVLTQLMYHGKKEFDIPPAAFTPPPKVMSSVLVLERRNDHLDKVQFKKLQSLVRTAFQFRRKTLRNNLKTRVSDPLLLSDLYYDQRPEAISPQDYKDMILNKKI
jgi:16S rRNA (adenine1518-N6/adenine1519-N6)-dimethyltransferase